MAYLVTDETRKLKEVPVPFQRSYLKEELLLNGKIDFKKLMHFFHHEGTLAKSLVEDIISKATNIFQMESNIVKVQQPVFIIGDLHGQFYDLEEFLAQNVNQKMFDEDYKLLFLGDYVDRGIFSLEILMILFTLKINFPKKVFLLRGNHECEQMTSYFNFKEECLKKYDQDVYAAIIDTFNYLPLAAVVNEQFFCVHGGISQELIDNNKIRRIDRFKQIPSKGLFCDLLWSDPVSTQDGIFSKKEGKQIENLNRGCSYLYGKDLVQEFLNQTQYKCIIRGHQAQQEGFKLYKWNGDEEFPPVITIFSAPNYCDFYNNKGAFIILKDNEMNIRQYKQVNHPYYLPHFMDAFVWSIPFVTEKISQFFYHLLQPNQKIQLNSSNDISLILKSEAIKNIINSQHKLVDQANSYMRLDGRTLDQELMKSQKALKYAKKQHDQDFQIKKQIDLVNEKRPKQRRQTF